VLNHFPLPRNEFQRLGHVLAENNSLAARAASEATAPARGRPAGRGLLPI
jgi:hypothetical protein